MQLLRSLATALLLLPAAARAQVTVPRLCDNGRVISDGEDTTIDAQHPKYFVEISEVSSRGKERLLHTSVPMTVGPKRMVCQRVNQPVDVDSKIVLRINRSFLEKNTFDGKFAVMARVDGVNGSRAVEVPGYSVIGKATESNPVAVADLSAMQAAMREIRKERDTVAIRLRAARARTTRDDRALQDQARGLADTIAALRRRAASDSAAVRTQQARVAAADSARRGLADTTATMPGLVAALDDARTRSAARQDSMRSAEVQLHNVQVALTSKTLREFLVEARGVLLERSHALIAIGAVAAPENQSLLRTYARAQRRLPQLVTQVALSTDSLWRAIMAQDFAAMSDTAVLKVWNGNVDNLRALLSELSGSDEPLPNEAALAALTLSVMRDAEVIVRQTGAQVGDVLVLTVMDTVGTQNANRTLEVRLPIREFGFVRRVSDAVLLMNVPGVEEKEEIAATQAAVDFANQGTSLSFPLNLRGSPSAGVTFGWTYLPRLDDDFAKVPYPLRVIFNWLRPGVGLNASVVSIAHKIITLTPKARSTEAAQEPAVAYTFGVVTTLFDSAVQWSVGRTLTGDRGRTYTGLGISFLAATDKAKDLFKALGK